MGVVDRPRRCLSSHPHPPKHKEEHTVLPRFTGVPVHRPLFRPSHSPAGIYNDCKVSEAAGPPKGIRFHQYLDDWLIRALSLEEAYSGKANTQTVEDLTHPLGLKINQEKSKLKLTQVLRIPPRFSPCKTYSREMAQTSEFDRMLKVKTCLTGRCFMSLIVLLASTEMMVPEGRLHMRPFQFHLKEHCRNPLSLNSLLPWSGISSAHLELWEYPVNVMKGADLHPKDQY